MNDDVAGPCAADASACHRDDKTLLRYGFDLVVDREVDEAALDGEPSTAAITVLRVWRSARFT
jgi:hypothetical protein